MPFLLFSFLFQTRCFFGFSPLILLFELRHSSRFFGLPDLVSLVPNDHTDVTNTLVQARNKRRNNFGLIDDTLHTVGDGFEVSTNVPKMRRV